MNGRYRHTQRGTVIRASLGAAVVLCSGIALVQPWPVVPLAVGIVVLVALALFSSLTVEVADGYLSLWFSLGVIRRRWPLDQVECACKVRNRWWYGWGIHLTPHGWLYNVSGLDAVKIRLRSGRRVCIGTDEPDALLAALARGEPASADHSTCEA